MLSIAMTAMVRGHSAAVAAWRFEVRNLVVVGIGELV